MVSKTIDVTMEEKDNHLDTFYYSLSSKDLYFLYLEKDLFYILRHSFVSLKYLIHQATNTLLY